jgi:Ca-activated chloride channel family protein
VSHRTIGLCALIVGGALVASAAQAGEPIGLEARLAQPVMKGGEAHKNYLRVALQGCKPQPAQNRTPVNVAFVIDRSGSMQGDAIAQAREAAIMAINRLLPTDIAAVVIFDHRVDVLVAAQNVTAPSLFTDLIRQIGVRGSTAIHAGVLAGGAEVAKFKEARRLNRVVLLSDGQANVGPTRPDEFGALGQALLAQGISVSTIGLGLRYNEDLMLQLARAGDGNHAFAREPTDLIQIFNKEFDDVLSSCAQTVSIDIELKPGVRAVRALSREGAIEGQRATFALNQVYAATEHYVLLEVELDKTLAADGEQELGHVKVGYTLPGSGARQTLDAGIRARFSRSDEDIKAGIDTKVSEAVVEQITRERTRRAVLLQDQGRVKEARELLMQNANEIQGLTASMAPSQRMLDLQRQYYSLGASAAPAAPSQLSLDRKVLRQLDAGAAGASVRY